MFCLPRPGDWITGYLYQVRQDRDIPLRQEALSVWSSIRFFIPLSGRGCAQSQRRTGSAKSYLDIIPATRDIHSDRRLDNRLSLSGPPGRRYTTHSDRRLNRFVLPPQARRLNNRLSLSGPPGRRYTTQTGGFKCLVKYPLQVFAGGRNPSQRRAPRHSPGSALARMVAASAVRPPPLRPHPALHGRRTYTFHDEAQFGVRPQLIFLGGVLIVGA